MSEALVGLTEHVTKSGMELDDDGWASAECACGFRSPPCPDIETLMDEMMSHVSLAVQKAHLETIT